MTFSEPIKFISYGLKTMRFTLSYFWPSWLWSAKNAKKICINDELGMEYVKCCDVCTLMIILLVFLNFRMILANLICYFTRNCK